MNGQRNEWWRVGIPRQPERFAERTRRLHRLLELDAPAIVIHDESVLVAQAFRGGRWHLLRYLFAEAVREASYWRLYAPAREFLCRRMGIHYRDEDGMCLVCCDGETFDDGE